MPLKVENSCETDNLIDEIIKSSGKNYEEVESAMSKAGLLPEHTKTSISWNDDQKNSIIVSYTMKDHPELDWLDKALVSIFKENNIDQIYITNAI